MRTYWASIVAIVRLCVATAPGLSTLATALCVANGLIPVSSIVLAGALVADVQKVLVEQPDWNRAVLHLAALGTVFILGHLAAPLTETVAHALGSQLSLALREQVMESTLRPVGIAHLEDATTAAKLEQAREPLAGAFVPAIMVRALGDIGATRIMGYSSVAIIACFRWWAAVVLLATWMALAAWLWRAAGTQIVRLEAGTSDLAHSTYYRDLGIGASAAKEIRIFGLPSWLGTRLELHWLRGMSDVWKLGATNWQLVPMHIGFALANGIVLQALTRAALTHEITLYAFVIYLQATLGTQHVGRTMAWWSRAMMGAVAARHASQLSLDSSGRTGLVAGLSARGLPEKSIELRDVSFRYPGSKSTVFVQLNLSIPAGRSLAIVGVNGAGKTSLVKLLSRLYEPSGGAITIDGHELGQQDPVQWRRQLAVIFQDFIHFELPARDNIGFGRLELRGDDRELTLAAEMAGAAELLRSLPRGLETILSRGYDGGTELSGGQWQRIALARALLAIRGGAKVLVLDEPTANLDVRAEAELFDRFLELTRGLTTILISHRFSTVRRADRICVVEAGRVLEEGSHDDLIGQNGRYAKMFALQASRFGATDVPTSPEAEHA